MINVEKVFLGLDGLCFDPVELRVALEKVMLEYRWAFPPEFTPQHLFDLGRECGYIVECGNMEQTTIWSKMEGCKSDSVTDCNKGYRVIIKNMSRQ